MFDDSGTMKLAEALKLRADLKVRIDEMGDRLRMNARVQEGELPPEDPAELIVEFDAMLKEYEELIWRINHTNASIKSEDGRTITQLIAHRDALSQRYDIMRSFLDSASSLAGRHSLSEIKIVSTVNVAQLRKGVDSIAQEMRLTDNMIQEMNWTNDLI